MSKRNLWLAIFCFLNPSYLHVPKHQKAIVIAGHKPAIKIWLFSCISQLQYFSALHLGCSVLSPNLAITPGRVKREATDIVFQAKFSEAGASLEDRFCESKIFFSDFTENWALHTPWTLGVRPHFAWTVKIYVLLSLARNIIFLGGTKEKINLSEISKISRLTRVSPEHSKSWLPSQLRVLLMPATGREGAHKLSDHQDYYMPVLIRMIIMIVDDHLAKMSLQVSDKTSSANTPHLMIMIMKPWSMRPYSWSQ